MFLLDGKIYMVTIAMATKQTRGVQIMEAKQAYTE
jgi:hypothetical protein